LLMDLTSREINDSERLSRGNVILLTEAGTSMSGEIGIEEYSKRLNLLVSRGKVRCQKCGNTSNFMVNEIGHIFCNRCHSKIPMIKLEKMDQ
jgi:late competence protein required for DNA uptake (superfamily II DNA/RNA helicase)